MKPLLIGQAPGPNTNPDMPMFPLPRSSAGGRLAAAMGINIKEYIRRFDRVNLIYRFPGLRTQRDRFPKAHARTAAQAMRPLLRERTVIFVGRAVAEAFGYRGQDLPFHVWISSPKWRFTCACIPHPSGRNPWYNVAENRQEALEFWQELMNKNAEK